MLKIKSLKLAAIAAMAICLLIIVKSCKKSDGDNSDAKLEAAKQKIQEQIRKDYGGDISASFVTPINKQAQEIFYKDASGKMIPVYNTNAGQQKVLAPNCQVTCSNATSVSQLSITFTLNYSERFYICEGAPERSSVRVKWTASVPFQLIEIISKIPVRTGNVRFKNSSGAVINTYTVTGHNVQSTLIGPDPACASNSLWEVAYNCVNIPNANFAAGNTVEAQVTISNDCALMNYTVSTAYVAGPAFSQNGYLPCNRLDKIFVNPSIGPTSPTNVGGLYTLSCAPPSGMQPIDFHQVEYRQVTTTNGDYTWDNQDISLSPIFNGVPQPANSGTSALMSPYGGVSSLPGMVQGTGKWLIRYRNVKTGTCGLINGSAQPPSTPNTNGNWSVVNESLWNTEMWDML
jgi:hypothetical protein